MELKKPNLAFRDLAQALQIDPKNKEFQLKLKEVTSLLGWSPDLWKMHLKQFEMMSCLWAMSKRRKRKKKKERKERKERKMVTKMKEGYSQVFWC
ncbi:hypothetical protein SOVF_122040 [Spinacia oleracea]|nr:hypothetical protein SOVF_122040 [Spinacia oleracea]